MQHSYFNNTSYLDFNMLCCKCPLLKVGKLNKTLSFLRVELLVFLTQYVDHLINYSPNRWTVSRKNQNCFAFSNFNIFLNECFTTQSMLQLLVFYLLLKELTCGSFKMSLKKFSAFSCHLVMTVLCIIQSFRAKEKYWIDSFACVHFTAIFSSLCLLIAALSLQ